MSAPVGAQKPRILLVDMPTSITEAVRKAGLVPARGSFGHAVRVDKSPQLATVQLVGELPEHQEQEIIFATTRRGELESAQVPDPILGVKTLVQSMERGAVDPRPFNMEIVREDFDAISKHLGVFVVEASRRYDVKYMYGEPRYATFSRVRDYELNNWGFLSILSEVMVESSAGSEITFSNDQLGRLLAEAHADASYDCTLAPKPSIRDSWTSICKNKYGHDVGALIARRDPRALILLLPRIPQLHTVVGRLLTEWLPEREPALFPFLETQSWVHRAEYEIPEVLRLGSEILLVDKEAAKRKAALQAQIEAVAAKERDLHTILQGTGDDLVQAVARILKRMGFVKIIDVDAEARATGQGQNLREDLQLHDSSPTLIVDIKGITGCPDDAETMQANKHAIMRLREWKRTDVQGLTIINHQRYLPPDRRDVQAFRPEMIANARDVGLGLMTTWDLFRLHRESVQLAWPADAVTRVLYRTGRIEVVPEHYTPAGSLLHVWKSALGLRSTQALQVGLTVAVLVAGRFVEFPITSMHVADAAVTEAPAGADVGIACDTESMGLRESQPLYVVRKP